MNDHLRKDPEEIKRMLETAFEAESSLKCILAFYLERDVNTDDKVLMEQLKRLYTVMDVTRYTLQLLEPKIHDMVNNRELNGKWDLDDIIERCSSMTSYISKNT